MFSLGVQNIQWLKSIHSLIGPSFSLGDGHLQQRSPEGFRIFLGKGLRGEGVRLERRANTRE